MNVFGLCMSFMVPGFVIGCMAGYCFRDRWRKKDG